MTTRIFIFCDDPDHASRHVAVTNFIAVGGGRWTEQFTSSAAQGTRESGITLDQDDAPWSGHDLADASEFRSRYQLACRKCRRRVVAREENLFAALNKLAEHGVSRISLARMAASLAMQSERS